jgi:hypothetical protein
MSERGHYGEGEPGRGSSQRGGAACVSAIAATLRLQHLLRAGNAGHVSWEAAINETRALDPVAAAKRLGITPAAIIRWRGRVRPTGGEK